VRFAKSAAHGVLGVILLILLLAVGINLFDDRQSRILDNSDPTNEEMMQAIPFAKEIK
jgi:hypothetical protein